MADTNKQAGSRLHASTNEYTPPRQRQRRPPCARLSKDGAAPAWTSRGRRRKRGPSCPWRPSRWP
eukprot:3584249-Pleurochrysis_carterae.AAC.1